MALVFLIQKVALIKASTHWAWVSIQGVNALTGLGSGATSVCAECERTMVLLYLYNFIRYILYIIYSLPLGGAEDGTQSLTQVGCEYHWKSALTSPLLQAYREEAEISTVLLTPEPPASDFHRPIRAMDCRLGSVPSSCSQSL